MDLKMNDEGEQPKHYLYFSKLTIRLLSVAYLLVIAVNELLIANFSPFLLVTFYIIVLFSVIIIGVLARNESQRRFWIVLGLAPLIRIVSLATPVIPQTPWYFWTIIIFIPIIVGIVTISRSLNLSPKDIGLGRKNLLVQFILGSTGIVLAIADYFILKPAALTKALTVQTTLFPALVLLIFTGLVEEIAFRGIMQSGAGALGSHGWIHTATLYALIQSGQGSMLHCLFTLGASLFFGWIVKKTGTIWGVGIAHGLSNIGLYLIFPHIL